jgi:hypothetical protein
MDFDAVSSALASYIESHHTQLAFLPVIQSQLLELGALVLSAEHYRINGYKIEAANLIGDNFKIKRTSRGWSWNFSWFRAVRGPHEVEIHTNLPVSGAYGKDGARYVVDIAICKPGVLPVRPTKDPNWSADNAALISFVEAKKLVIYPMLLAQFIGIVHELKPNSLAGRRQAGFSAGKHFNPTLVTTGPWAKSCEPIYQAFADRRYRIRVLPNLDVILADLRYGSITESPF